MLKSSTLKMIRKQGGKKENDTDFKDGKVKPWILPFRVLPWMTIENPTSDADTAASSAGALPH